MRVVHARAPLCDRAREWISLQLDGELSEFERVMLEGHVSTCVDCSDFRLDAESISTHLRRAALVRLERPVEIPRRQRVSARAFPLVAASAAAIVVAAASTLGVSTLDRSDHTSTTRPAYLDSAAYEMQLIKQTQTVRLLAAFRRAGAN